jgi:serine phosphatase RsbU (regulator of sigma subunit)/tetratricopeptide (TPR) repeat protein
LVFSKKYLQRTKVIFCLLLFLTASHTLFAQTATELNKQAEAIINEDPDQSIVLAEKALQKAKKEDNIEQEAEALLNLGIGKYYLDEYSDAIKITNQALKLAVTFDDKTIEGKCECIIGEIYVYTAEYSKSLNHLSKARKIFEDTDNKIELARCNNNMGIIHKNQYNLNEALVYFQKAFDMGDDLRKGDASLYMGQVYIAQKKFTDADKILKKAVELANKNSDNYVLADAYLGLGEVNISFGKKEAALKYLSDALKIKEEVEDQQGVCNVSNTLGNLYMQNNEPLKAHNLFLRSAQIASKINTREELKDAYLGLSNTYHIKDIDDSAYLFLDMYNNINEDILSEEASKKLSQIEESLVAEKLKQKEEHDRFIDQVKLWSFIGIILIIGIFGFVFYKRYKEKQRANVEIMRQKAVTEEQMKIIEEKNHEITDSINYAKRIQNAVLPAEQEFTNSFKDSFVLLKPKDIVSGDFYWFTKANPVVNKRRGDSFNRGSESTTDKVETSKEVLIYATADCTGHGVPGGFMSMLGTSLLNEIINEGKIYEPAKALDLLRDRVINGLKQTGASGENKDGMDIVLTVFDLTAKTLSYAAANNGFYLIRNNEIIDCNPDKQPIGFYGDAMKPFTQNLIELQDGDCIYTFTDGYADQFGGPRGKKFKYKTMEEKLLEIHHLPMQEQKQIMDKTIMDWMGDIEQNDDICLIAVRI